MFYANNYSVFSSADIELIPTALDEMLFQRDEVFRQKYTDNGSIMEPSVIARDDMGQLYLKTSVDTVDFKGNHSIDYISIYL